MLLSFSFSGLCARLSHDASFSPKWGWLGEQDSACWWGASLPGDLSLPSPPLPYLQELDGHLGVSRGFVWSSGFQSIQEQYVRCWASSWSSGSDVYEWNGVSTTAELGLREWLWTRWGRRGLVWNLYSSKIGSFRNWSLEKSENWHSSFAYQINNAELLKIPGAWLSLIAWEAQRKPGLCLPGTFPPILCGLRRLGNRTGGFILPCENENTIQNCVLHSFKLV